MPCARRRQRVGHLRGHAKGGFDRQRPSLRNPCRQRVALNQRHHDVGTVTIVAGLEDGADVRVIEPGRGLGFDQQAPVGVRIQHIGPDPLDGDLAVESRVLGDEHFPHPASAKPRPRIR